MNKTLIYIEDEGERWIESYNKEWIEENGVEINDGNNAKLTLMLPVVYYPICGIAFFEFFLKRVNVENKNGDKHWYWEIDNNDRGRKIPEHMVWRTPCYLDPVLSEAFEGNLKNCSISETSLDTKMYNVLSLFKKTFNHIKVENEIANERNNGKNNARPE